MTPFYIFLFPAFHLMLKIPLLLPSHKDSSIRHPSFLLCKTFHHTSAALFLPFLTLNVFLPFLVQMKIWPQQDLHDFHVLWNSVSRSGLVRFFSLFWTRPGPDQSSEISFLGKNRTGLGKTGLHRSGLRYLSTLNQLRPRLV